MKKLIARIQKYINRAGDDDVNGDARKLWEREEWSDHEFLSSIVILVEESIVAVRLPRRELQRVEYGVDGQGAGEKNGLERAVVVVQL